MNFHLNSYSLLETSFIHPRWTHPWHIVIILMKKINKQIKRKQKKKNVKRITTFFINIIAIFFIFSFLLLSSCRHFRAKWIESVYHNWWWKETDNNNNNNGEKNERKIIKMKYKFLYFCFVCEWQKDNNPASTPTLATLYFIQTDEMLFHFPIILLHAHTFQTKKMF